MDRILFDLRVACRRLRSRPGFALTAILSLGFGIAATTLFFSLLNSTLLKPLPVHNPHELLSTSDSRFDAPVLSYPVFRDLRQRSTEYFSGVAAYRMLPLSMSTGPGRNSRTWGLMVSGNYFEVLGVKAAHGRTLTVDDDRTPGGHPFVVISDSCWKSRFGGDAEILGRAVKLNGYPFTVVGVLAPGMYGTERFYAPEFFGTSAMEQQMEPGSTYVNDRDSKNTFVVGRLAQGVSRARAQAGIDSFAAQMAKEFPKFEEGLELKLTEPGWAGNYLRGKVIGFNIVLMAIAGALLLVVCVNLASLLIAQAAERRKEIAVRLALGAARGQLIRQLALESLVLGAIGGVLGLLCAMWGAGLISNFRPPIDFSIHTTVSVDWAVALFAFGLTVASSLFFGMIPALQAARTDVAASIKNDVADVRSRKWPLRDLLVGAQVTVSVVLLGASALMLASMRNAVSVSLGFQPQGAAMLGADLSTHGYTAERGRQFQKDLLRMAREIPGVESAGITSAVPLEFAMSNNSAYETGQPEPPPSQMILSQTFWISPEYLKTLRTKLIAGRDHAETDIAGKPPVLIVNAEFTRQILKLPRPELAVGRKVHVDGKDKEVIGVVEDGKYFGLNEAPKPAMFHHSAQGYTSNFRLVWRMQQGSPDASVKRMRELVNSLDNELAISPAQTLEEHMHLPLLPSRLATGALSTFGLVTLLLAALGLYGVTAFAVSRRTREIGIRMAIGATPKGIAAMLLRRAGILVGIAGALGLVMSLVVSSILEPFLVGVNPRDWLAHTTGAGVMTLIGLAACWIPSRKASLMDPARALRQE